jgi:hypothetical protein
MTRRRIAPAISPPRSLLKEPSPIQPLPSDRGHSYRRVLVRFSVSCSSLIRNSGILRLFRIGVVPSSAFGPSCCFQLAC